ncbi:MAG: hypothetical protein ABII90_07695 [Bacteroidota bacterium]
MVFENFKGMDTKEKERISYKIGFYLMCMTTVVLVICGVGFAADVFMEKKDLINTNNENIHHSNEVISIFNELTESAAKCKVQYMIEVGRLSTTVNDLNKAISSYNALVEIINRYDYCITSSFFRVDKKVSNLKKS